MPNTDKVHVATEEDKVKRQAKYLRAHPDKAQAGVKLYAVPEGESSDQDRNSQEPGSQRELSIFEPRVPQDPSTQGVEADTRMTKKQIAAMFIDPVGVVHATVQGVEQIPTTEAISVPPLTI